MKKDNKVKRKDKTEKKVGYRVVDRIEPDLRLAHFTYGKRRHYTLSTLPE